MSKFNSFLIFTGLILVILAISNPKEQAHKDAVKNKVNEMVQKGISDTGLSGSGIASGLGSALSNLVMEQIADKMVNRQDYVIFSLTKLGYAGSTKTIGVGILGNVFLSTKLDKDLREWQEKAGNLGSSSSN